MANILRLAGPGSIYHATGVMPAGFWIGVWHGVISPITFIVSLFKPNIRIYEMNNRGRLYDCGFIIGASVAFGGGQIGGQITLKNGSTTSFSWHWNGLHLN